MLVTNKNSMEEKIKEILEKKGKGGWLRVTECAKLYAKENRSLETKYYRWKKKVEKGKVPGFQTIKLPGNVSFIGLDSADPRILESFISKSKRTFESFRTSFGFFEWLERRAERKAQEKDKEIREVEAEFGALKEIARLYEVEWSQEKEWEIRKKWRKRKGLN